MLLLFRCIIIKVFILISLYTFPVKAQLNIDFLNSIFNKIYVNLIFYKKISYDLKITTLEANNITSIYTAKVTEIYDNDSNYVLYELSNKQILFSYSNILGIQRFWVGRINDLPEISSKDFDNKILTTAISYSNLNINPLWFNIPINYKNDQGFLVIQSYNKNIYTNFPKVEFYINKENIPVRVLYYNNISSFPILEVLVSDYKKDNKGYVIYKTEYKDHYSKKVTIIEKSNISFDLSIPEWFENIVDMINNNISNYYTSFMMGIRDKTNISELNESFNKITLKENNKSYDISDGNLSNKEQITEKNLKLSPIPLTNTPSINKENKNTALLKELDSLNSTTFKESNSFNDVISNNMDYLDKNNNKKIKQKELDSKIKHKKLDDNKKVQKKSLDNNKYLSKKSNNLKKLDEKQHNMAKEKKLNEITNNDVIYKKQIDKKATIETKNSPKSKLQKDSTPVNKNNIPKDMCSKDDENLKLKDSTVKSIPKEKENIHDKDTEDDISVKKEKKKKNLLNNLF